MVNQGEQQEAPIEEPPEESEVDENG